MKPGVVKILVNRDSCQGCRACEAVCSLKHFGAVNPHTKGIEIIEKEELGRFKQIVCQQCLDMDCAQVCPQNAISRDNFTGAVIVGESCIGCGKCVDACSLGAIRVANINGEKRAIKCDLCGGIPECVAVCPRQVLSW